MDRQKHTVPLSFLVKILHLSSCPCFSWEAIHRCAFQAEMHTWGWSQGSVETHIQPCSRKRKRTRKGRMEDVLFKKSQQKATSGPIGVLWDLGAVLGLGAGGNSWGGLGRASPLGSLSMQILSFCIHHTHLRYLQKLLQICKRCLYRN